MKKYNITFLPEAYKDLDLIFDYILLDSINQAESMLDMIMNSIDTLSSFPLSGVRLDEKLLKNYKFRMIIVKPYIVFYRLIDDTIYIYRVLHGAMDYIDALKRV